MLLTAAGATETLRVHAFDAAGLEVIGAPITFTSSRPAALSVAADGTVRAEATLCHRAAFSSAPEPSRSVVV